MNRTLFTRNFVLLLVGQVFSLIGNYTLRFALSMYVLELTGSAEIFGTILAASVVPTILLSPLGGVMADRMNRRWMMVALDIVSGLSVLGCGLLLQEGAGLAAVVTLQMGLGIVAAFESPTVQACVPQLVGGADLLRANALVNQAQALAGWITPFAGSILYTTFGLEPVLLTTGGCFLLTAFLECWISLPAMPQAEPQRPRMILRRDLHQSMQFLVREQPLVLRLLLLAAGMNFFASGCITVGLPFLVRTRLGLSATWYGAAESFLGITVILGGFLVTVLADKLPVHGMYRCLSVFGIALFPPAVTFAMVRTPSACYGILLAALAVAEIGCSIFSVWGLCAIQERTPPDLTGKVMACVITISQCAQPAGQLVYGVLWDRLPSEMVLLVSGSAVCLVAAASRGIFSRLERTMAVKE